MYVEGNVVGHKTRKKHGLRSFTIRSLRRRGDRLGGEPRLGESGAQSVKSRQNFLLDGELVVEELGREPGHRRTEGIQTEPSSTPQAVLQRSGLCAMKRAIRSSLVFGVNSDAS